MDSQIILVQPKAGDYEYAGLKPPDSLLAISALPIQEGYKVKIIDQRTDNDWKNTLKKHLGSAICVGTTSMTGGQIKYALEISKFVKENSDLPVIWGGVHSSLLPEQTIKHEFIDIILKGEGDFAFLEIVKALEKNNLKEVKGIYYKEKNIIKKTQERPLIEDLDKLPRTPYELVDLNSYFGFDINSEKSITMTTSRGCPFSCGFCYNTVYNKNRWRGKSAERTIEDIKYVKERFGIKSIYFQDDNFCANIKRFKDIVNGLITENIDVNWGLLGARVDSLKQMDDKFLDKVIMSGCDNINIGVESGSQRLLNIIDKHLNIPDIIAVNKKLTKFAGIAYTFVIGIPTETEEELIQSIKLAIRLEKDNPSAFNFFSIYCAYPKTPLFKMTVKHGFKEPEKLEDWLDINLDEVARKYPWLSKRRIRMLEMLRFTSYFESKNVEYKISKPMIKLMVKLYRPIAKFRFRNNFYNFFIERKIANAMSRLQNIA